MKSIILFVFIAFIALGCSNDDQGPILIADFEVDNYGDWIQEGTAFNNGPGIETLGYIGKRHATSLNYNNEPGTGTLTSPPFTIERNSIHFLLGAREIDFLSGAIRNPEELSIQLLVDNEVVRSTTPDEFHAMFHYGWDVSELKGKTARIRIADMIDKENVFIDVDHIVQNNIPVDGIDTERSFQITGSQLNLPVKHGSKRYYFELYSNDSLVRAFDIELGVDSIDYRVKTDVSPWLGQELILKTKQYFEYDHELLDKITVANKLIDSENLYQEKLRPQFHFSAQRGWVNDPNGLVYYDGEFHLFYQANPFGRDHSRNDYNKTWGHAVSKDLIHWEELPAAINPDHLGSIYSGSAVVDHYNKTGFKKGDEAPIIAVYTSAGTRNRWSLGKSFTQSIAYSNDRGRTFKPYENNPVQGNIGYINRDPKAFWYEPTEKWVIVLYLDHGAFVFFNSDDLKSWEQQSILNIEDFGVNDIAAFEDCPELFLLPVDGDPDNTKWVLYAGSGDYVLGDFNGKRFVPETGLIKYNYGDCFYASQTFNNVPECDGRRIQIAWGTVDFPGMPFNQMITFPVSLTLRSTSRSLRMYANPVREIEQLYDKVNERMDIQISPGDNLLEDYPGGSYDVEIDMPSRIKAKIQFEASGKEIIFDLYEQKIFSDDIEINFPQNDSSELNLRLLVDIKSIEIFVNNGEYYIPLRIEGNADTQSISLTTDEVINIQSLKVRTLNSIWND
jgi:sucrose-6-phosphate hydrolase SacC (GH32 family)